MIVLKSSLMKRLLIIFLLAVLFIPARAHAGVEERISNFRVNIDVREDASVRVTETITYDFGTNERHGIYRTIPVKYQARGGSFRLRVSEVSVFEAERGAPFTTSRTGNDLKIKIGDADALVTGKHTYAIEYVVDRAITYFDDHDELYWNATGDEWQVPIDHAEAFVRLPSDTSLDVQCFIGPRGSTLPCESTGAVSGAALFTANNLGAQEGLTIVVGFPKGAVREPSALEQILSTIRDNIILGLPIVVFLVFFWLWWTRGRDPKGRGTIIAEYDAPDNLTPAEVGTIMDEHAHRRDISSLLIHLAVNGYLDITRIDKTMRKDDYLFKKLKDEKTLANDFERTLLSKMFGEKTEIKLSDLKNTFYKDLVEVIKQLYDTTASKGYFIKNPQKVRMKYMIGSAVLLMVFFPLLGQITEFFGGNIGALAIGSMVASGLIIFIFGLAMPMKTRKGVRAKEHIAGLKEYLTVAEKDRLKFHNAPEKNPRHFETLLPFAMALGVEKEWAKQFEGLYATPPSWYHDSGARAFSSVYFASSLSDFSSRTSSVMASRPGSAASGGSGLGGGGFSGGGFGGGGGGSW